MTLYPIIIPSLAFFDVVGARGETRAILLILSGRRCAQLKAKGAPPECATMLTLSIFNSFNRP